MLTWRKFKIIIQENSLPVGEYSSVSLYAHTEIKCWLCGYVWNGMGQIYIYTCIFTARKCICEQSDSDFIFWISFQESMMHATNTGNSRYKNNFIQLACTCLKIKHGSLIDYSLTFHPSPTHWGRFEEQNSQFNSILAEAIIQECL